MMKSASALDWQAAQIDARDANERRITFTDILDPSGKDSFLPALNNYQNFRTACKDGSRRIYDLTREICKMAGILEDHLGEILKANVKNVEAAGWPRPRSQAWTQRTLYFSKAHSRA